MLEEEYSNMQKRKSRDKCLYGIAIYLTMLFDIIHYLGIDIVHQFSQISITFFIVGTV